MRRSIGFGVLIGLVALAGCTVMPAEIVPALPSDRAVSDEWQSFPVGRGPRPIVVIGEVPAMAGFTTDAAKHAVMSRTFVLRTEPTPEARRAYEAMTRDATPDASVPALPITRVELGTAVFSTDRGQVPLPAWLFHADDTLGPIAWPAGEPSSFWRLGQVRPSISSAGATSTGLVLTAMLPAPPDPCPGSPPVGYEPIVTETATTVTIGTRIALGSPRPGNCTHTLVLRLASYEITLMEPLGDRVLLDTSGGVISVLTEG